MSLFLLHQTSERAILLADSLATRTHANGAGSFKVSASKLVRITEGVFAAHAGTWQPAVAMLMDLKKLLEGSKLKKISHKSLVSKMQRIGVNRFKEFTKRFGKSDFDLRIALILTGVLRDPLDIKDGFSTTIMIWEKARGFIPYRSRGQIYFAGNRELSKFATAILDQPLMKDMLGSTVLSAVQALKATHAILAGVSAVISEDSNVVAITGPDEYELISGIMYSITGDVMMGG